MSKESIEKELVENRLEEVRRIVDNQIEAKGRIQNRALSIIRLQIAIIGILITSIVTVRNRFDLSQFFQI